VSKASLLQSLLVFSKYGEGRMSDFEQIIDDRFPDLLMQYVPGQMHVQSVSMAGREVVNNEIFHHTDLWIKQLGTPDNDENWDVWMISRIDTREWESLKMEWDKCIEFAITQYMPDEEAYHEGNMMMVQSVMQSCFLEVFKNAGGKKSIAAFK